MKRLRNIVTWFILCQVAVCGCEKTYNEAVCEEFCNKKGGTAVDCSHVPDGKCACHFTQPPSHVELGEVK